MDHLQKELSDMSLSYDRLRTDMAKERARHHAVATGSKLPASSNARHPSPNVSTTRLQAILEHERAEFRREKMRLKRELEDARALLARRGQNRHLSPHTARNVSATGVLSCYCDIYYIM